MKGCVMKRYLNRNGNSGITAYEYGDDFIIIEFKSGNHRKYKYKASSVGESNLTEMKYLADKGSGLNAFIMRNGSVKNGYVEKF